MITSMDKSKGTAIPGTAIITMTTAKSMGTGT